MQQPVAGKERAAQVAQKLEGAFALEVADRAAEEHHQERFIGLPFGRGSRHPIQIGLHQRMHLGQIRQVAFAARQGVGRYIDGIVAHRAPDGLQQMPRLLAYAAAQFDDRDRRWKQTRDIAGMTAQQTLVRARQSIFRKMRNGLKERAA